MVLVVGFTTFALGDSSQKCFTDLCGNLRRLNGAKGPPVIPSPLVLLQLLCSQRFAWPSASIQCHIADRCVPGFKGGFSGELPPGWGRYGLSNRRPSRIVKP